MQVSRMHNKGFLQKIGLYSVGALEYSTWRSIKLLRNVFRLLILDNYYRRPISALYGVNFGALS